MSNLTSHAQRELELAGWFNKESDYEGMIGEAIMELMTVFAKQDHSGFSASIVSRLFNKLSRYEPLNPLTGEDSEWEEVETGVFQNRRCSKVFRENGQAYNVEGRIFRDPDGSTWVNSESRVNITFPYTPRTEYKDRP